MIVLMDYMNLMYTQLFLIYLNYVDLDLNMNMGMVVVVVMVEHMKQVMDQGYNMRRYP